MCHLFSSKKLLSLGDDDVMDSCDLLEDGSDEDDMDTIQKCILS